MVGKCFTIPFHSTEWQAGTNRGGGGGGGGGSSEIHVVGIINLLGVDPGFLERGFICINVGGFALQTLSLIFLNIP